jgi:hypothetical protein
MALNKLNTINNNNPPTSILINIYLLLKIL